MSTVFGVPCPDCGRLMSVAAAGELQCQACGGSYHARMGHLFPVAEPPDAKVVISESPPGRGPAARPTTATS